MWREVGLVLSLVLVCQAAARSSNATLPPTAGAQSSGLLSVDETNDGQMFYWLFRCANASAPMIIWLEGGPGIPGSFQVFYGMGPYRVSDDLQVHLHPETWNQHFHLLFFDNPVGVGYSSIQNQAYVTNEQQVATQLARALDQVLGLYPEFQETSLYLMGESYGGKYVPSLAYYMLQHTEQYKWHFAGIGIGDGLVDTPVQVSTFADFAYMHGLVTLQGKKKLQTWQEQFASLMAAEEFDKASNIFWDMNYYMQYVKLVNFYDIDCDSTCSRRKYSWDAYAVLLNEPQIKTQLHVPTDYEFNSQAQAASQALNPDVCQSVASLFPELLSRYKTLLFQGTLDMICNAPGNDLWLSQVPWRGMSAFQNQSPRLWFDKLGNVAGYVRQSSNLTQIVLPNAGHFVTMDQPSRSLEMVYHWIYNLPLTTPPDSESIAPAARSPEIL